MNNTGKVIGLLSLGVIYYLAQAKDFLKGYTVKFITAKLDTGLTQNSGFSKLYFNIKLKISNSTEFKGKITGGDIQLSYKGRRIGESQTIPQIDIEPKSEVEIVIPAIIRTSEILYSLVNVYQLLSTAAPIEFKVTGKINFAAGTYFVNELYQVKI